MSSAARGEESHAGCGAVLETESPRFRIDLSLESVSICSRIDFSIATPSPPRDQPRRSLEFGVHAPDKRFTSTAGHVVSSHMLDVQASAASLWRPGGAAGYRTFAQLRSRCAPRLMGNRFRSRACRGPARTESRSGQNGRTPKCLGESADRTCTGSTFSGLATRIAPRTVIASNRPPRARRIAKAESDELTAPTLSECSQECEQGAFVFRAE